MPVEKPNSFGERIRLHLLNSPWCFCGFFCSSRKIILIYFEETDSAGVYVKVYNFLR